MHVTSINSLIHRSFWIVIFRSKLNPLTAPVAKSLICLFIVPKVLTARQGTLEPLGAEDTFSNFRHV
jgi:hypothetical protein